MYQFKCDKYLNNLFTNRRPNTFIIISIVQEDSDNTLN